MKRAILLAGLAAATCLISAPGRAAQAEPCGVASSLQAPCERPLPPCDATPAPCNR
jgi:hypothetical protein